MCVCVFLGSMCLKLLLRDDFENLKFCLDLWLSCMFDCIHICVFSLLEKLFLSNLNSSSTPSLSVELLSCFLSQSRHLSIARWIDRESFYPLNSSSTATSIHRACFAVDTSKHLLDSWICRNLLMLDTSRHLLSVENY